MKRIAIGLAAAVLAVLLIGCQAASGGATGEVTFNITDTVAKAIWPSTSLDAGRYYLFATGVSGQALGQTIELNIIPPETSATLNLLPGDWSLDAEVFNDETPEVSVGAGHVDFEVQVGTPMVVPVLCAPHDGMGTLDVAVSWVPDVISVPEVEVEVRPFGGSSVSVPMTLQTSVSATGSASLDDGWYVSALRILDNGILSAGVVRSLRVAANFLTTWTEYLEVSALEGEITIDINYNSGPPLVLVPDVAEGRITLYGTQTRIITIAEPENDAGTSVAFAWYKNGVLTALSTSNSYTLDAADFPEGEIHYISAVAIQSDGARMGDCQWSVTNGGYISNSVEFQWIAGQAANFQFYFEKQGGGSGAEVVTVAAGANSHTITFPSEGNWRMRLGRFDGENLFEKEYWEQVGTEAAATWIAIPVLGEPKVCNFGSLDF